jgi:integrase
MSVYKRPTSPFFHYDFRYKGQRFHGSTGCANERDAAAFEREEKEKVKRAGIKPQKLRAVQMTIGQACQRYWNEKGQFLERCDQVNHSLEMIVAAFGEDTPLAAISNNKVAEAVAHRRASRVRNTARDGGPKPGNRSRKRSISPGMISPAWVNRSFTDPLRKVMRRASETWEERVQKIRWSDHRLEEPSERIRELSRNEQQRLFSALPTVYLPIIRFTLKMATRIGESVSLSWQNVDLDAGVITLLRKRGKLQSIPISDDVVVLLREQIGRNQEFVFAYDNGNPMTYSGVDSVFGRAVKRAGIKDFRLHDLRHTGATRLVRETGNLRLAKDLLGHAKIETTMRYAHATQEDLRHALNRVADAEANAKGPDPIVPT